MNILLILRNYWAPILLACIGCFVCVANYEPGTFLSGWDTLHPEFNFTLAFERAIFGVFRPEQGLGAVAGHSHMADLPHIFLLWISNFFLQPITQAFNQPDGSLLRYFYIFLCFLIGPLGMYFFLRHLIPQKFVCFLGALFYMLNIGTVQLFYVPFEMFTTQFALLPFLFYFSTNFLLMHRKRSLAGFMLVSIFLSPTAFASPLWYVMFVILISYVSVICYLRKTFFQGFLLIGTMLLLNAYWILPNIYFVLLHGKDVTLAATNQLFSEEAFYYNKAFGNFSSVALLQTFYFAWHIYDHSAFMDLMQVWKTHIQGPTIAFEWISFALAVLGILSSIKKQKIVLVSLFPGVAISFIFWLNDTLPFHLYSLLQNIPFFQEAFRFPDDKILGIFVFIYTIFFTVGIATIARFLKHITIRTTYYTLLAFCILFSAFPAFYGHLIHPAMRITIPQEYFAFFDYMNAKPSGRIATLPIHSPWGWEYYQWHPSTGSGQKGFQGSGFLYFGLKDPTMDRDFDRWNPENESYYRELSYAVYAQNQQLFERVLEKYDIRYVVLDTSIIAPGDQPSILFFHQLQQLLTTQKIRSIAQFGNHLFVFQTQFPSNIAQIRYQENILIKPGTQTAFVDMSYLQTGTYSTGTTKDSTDNLGRVNSFFVQTASIHKTQDFFPVLATPTINTCPSVGSATKQRIATTQPFIEYVATQGQYCDHVSVRTSQKQTPLLIRIESRTPVGLSLRLCIADATNGHCILQTKLPKTTTFTLTTFLIPPLPTTRLSINIANIGAASSTSINDISKITTEELPPQTITPTNNETPATPLSFVSLNNMSYRLDNPPSHATLILSQSYEPGWQLYAVDKTTPAWLAQTFPFLAGKQIGTHIVVNSWENGWVLPTQSTNDQLIIVFLPQYLEYFGFAIGVGTIIVICSILFVLRKKSHSR